jgi:hypothetical protein
MRHHILTAGLTALALVGSSGAQAQGIYVADPVYAAPPAAVYAAPAPYTAAPVVVEPAPYAAAPMVVAPAPNYVAVAPPATVVAPPYDYAYVPGYAEPTTTTVVNYRTGRRCTVEPNGYRWCWTP